MTGAFGGSTYLVRALNDEQLCARTLNGVQIIDLRTGARQRQLSWNDLVESTWQGRKVLLASPPRGLGALGILDRSTLETLTSLEPPTGDRGSVGFDAALGVVFLTASGVWRLTDKLKWEPIGARSLDQPLSSSAHALRVLDLRGTEALMEILMGRAGILELVTRRWRGLHDETLARVAYSQRSRRFVMGDVHGVKAFDPEDPRTPRWTRPVPLGVQRVAIDPDCEFVVTASPSGELAKLGLETGELHSRTTFNENLRGARFSRGNGLEDHVIDGLQLAGAIIDD